MQVRRTHDKLYLDENRYKNTKEIFKFIYSKAFSSEIESDVEICDFGCAAGEFLYYLKAMRPKSRLTGFELLPELAEKAKAYVPDAEIITGSVLEKNHMTNDQFDISFLIGVHSIFDEFQTCFENIINWTRPGGRVYIVGMFNPFPVDVWVKYRESKNIDDNSLESGWNIFSQETVSNYLRKNKRVIDHSFSPFEISIDLPRQEDPVRSWTLRDYYDKRLIVNGLCLIQPHYVLEILL
ncbi:methyltransferase domain-containing protein [Candidatus Methylopumilus universalis]|nr:methyltransferase domain-containing protein [Candidatus Methylopumilus universalis]